MGEVNVARGRLNVRFHHDAGADCAPRGGSRRRDVAGGRHGAVDANRIGRRRGRGEQIASDDRHVACRRDGAQKHSGAIDPDAARPEGAACRAADERQVAAIAGRQAGTY